MWPFAARPTAPSRDRRTHEPSDRSTAVEKVAVRDDLAPIALDEIAAL
jgi:hypothetical protein